MASEFSTSRIIEFADTDMAGIAHFSRFFLFMEQTEHAFFRSLGLSIHMRREEELVTWPRVSTHCDYAHPIRFEEELAIHLKVERKRTRTLTYAFRFNKGDEEIANGGLTTVCCRANPGEKMRAIPIPAYIDSMIEAAPTAGEDQA
jgi:acyl-CoA thioester hydrolase